MYFNYIHIILFTWYDMVNLLNKTYTAYKDIHYAM